MHATAGICYEAMTFVDQETENEDRKSAGTQPKERHNGVNSYRTVTAAPLGTLLPRLRLIRNRNEICAPLPSCASY